MPRMPTYRPGYISKWDVPVVSCQYSHQFPLTAISQHVWPVAPSEWNAVSSPETSASSFKMKRLYFFQRGWYCFHLRSETVCVWYNSAVWHYFLQSFLVIWCLMYISVCTHLKHVLEILYFLCVVFGQQSIRAERENKRADKLICAGFQLKLQVKKLWFVV